MRALATRLRQGAEGVAALLFATMFGAFVLQVFMRYVVNRPLEWTLEVCLIAYVWIAFWSAAFLVREDEHVAFNLIYVGVPPSVRRVLAVLISLVIGGAFAAALPATFDFVKFMGIDTTWVLELRFDVVFSVFVLFMVAVIARAALRLRALLSRRWRDEL
jgi:TRAP-type C4-dicarboxylate transport system permease small subunit